MGVLACDRKGCENIMCCRYSDEYGYICNECFDELEKDKNFISIEHFMNTKKRHYNNLDNSFDNINEIFKIKDDDEYY